MTGRWRGRGAALVLVIALAAVPVAAGVDAGAGDRRVLVVSDPGGRTLARVPLCDDAAFTLRYRNSVYGTLAEERFVVADDGGFELRELAAEQLAVLEEYYGVSEQPMLVAREWWRAPPAYELELDRLTVAATDLGRRTLLVAGQPPLLLWHLVEDAAPSVVIEADPGA
ncbi:MAG: hypothetical protein ACRDWI_10920 [Jiangellaceae bacterium]